MSKKIATIEVKEYWEKVGDCVYQFTKVGNDPWNYKITQLKEVPYFIIKMQRGKYVFKK